MQRGIQVLTPEADLRDIRDRDLFTSPRSSGDFSRRVSAIMAPTRSSGILQKDSPSTSLALQTSPPQITTAISTATATMSRSIVSQRRVSLPCIIESPTSPMGPATPRHSCDLPKSPMYAEPLHTRTTSGALRRDCMPAAQKANATPTASLLTTRPQPQKTQPQTLGGRQTNNNPKDQSSKQKSASVQQHSPLDKVASSGLFAGVPEAISNNVSRRRSIDISALSVLASRTSLHLRRQRSLDLLGAQTPVPAPVVAEAAAAVPDPTAAASSYADPAVTDEDSRQPESKIRRDSDASTSETIVSGQSSCATLVNPMMQVLDDGKPPVQDSIEKTPANPMARSTSQPPLSHTSVSSAARRSASASEPSVRQSFDLRLFAGRDRLGMEEDEQHEALNKNRRRSIHDPLFTMKEEPEIGPRLLGMSSLQNETLSHLSRKGSVSSSSSTSKSRGSFSGSATVSGRFSRFLWYGSDHHSTSASNMGPDHSFWNSSSSGVGDLAETNNSTEAIHQETGERKTRTGMMNRLSGIWSRR
ncbi:hypothetical protein BGZ75_003555 [Mortierella antarctica]|nr:hypothetical protein BGZ75_003555 [Mortierella antarctica]